MADYSDDFERANTFPSDDLGADWTLQTSPSYCILGGRATPNTSSSQVAAFWDNGAFTDDQYSEYTIALADSQFQGPTVRASGTGGSRNFYFGRARTVFNDWEIGKIVAGSYTSLATGSVTPANGDVLRLEVSGTGLTLKRNGVTLGTTTDSSLSSGSAGICGDDVSVRCEAWAGGDLGGGETSTPPPHRLRFVRGKRPNRLRRAA